MKNIYLYIIIAIFVVLVFGITFCVIRSRDMEGVERSSQSQQDQMTFFVTSVNPGKGADFGGIQGADEYCTALAASSGAGNRVWRAYLSTSATADAPAINARDRIGQGPWKNFQGVVIARSLEELHGENNITKQTALTEKGSVVNGRGDTPNLHDILTGSDSNGMAISGSSDTTCGNWTRNDEGSAIVGHSDRIGTSDTPEARSWNSSHASRGCDLEALASSGGRGLIYCFATSY